METIETHVNIPADRHLVIDLHIPHTIPTGSMDIVLVFHSHKKKPAEFQDSWRFQRKDQDSRRL
jgi:hypothetical protein